MGGNRVTESIAKPKGEGGPLGGLSKQHLVIVALVVALFLVLGFIGFRWAMHSPLATLVEFSGEPDRDKSAEREEWFDAVVGDDFFEGDGARTPSSSVAQFTLNNGARLTLKPASQVRFQKKAGRKGALKLSVEVGEADVRTNAGTLFMDSEFGEIQIDKNSRVTLRRDGKRMVLGVELGRIELGGGKRSIAAGESIELELGGIIIEEEAEEPEADDAPAEVEETEEEVVELQVGDGVQGADVTANANDSFVIHDPNPPTKVGFRFSEVCDGPARLTVGRLSTEGEKRGALRLVPGRHTYQVHCLSEPDKVAASGTVRILRDGGTRRLPSFAPSASVVTDGRRYTVLYQQKLPTVTVSWPTAPESSSYTLRVGGRSFSTKTPSYTLRSGSLRPGTHTAVFSAASSPPRQSRTTTIKVVYDSQAPAARVATQGGFEPGAEVKVAGQALPGWSVSVDGKELEVDSQRKFKGEFTGDGTLPIAFSHPTHGMHYYLRRPRAASPP